MGASGWEYVTKYEKDVGRAFDRVCQEAFDGSDWREAVAWMGDEVADALVAELATLGPGATWRDGVQIVFGFVQEDGTHSILDMTGVGTTRNFGVLRLVSSQEMLAIYGTATPTQDDVDQCMASFSYERWTGIAHPLHDAKGTPTHWYFEGRSGD